MGEKSKIRKLKKQLELSLAAALMVSALPWQADKAFASEILGTPEAASEELETGLTAPEAEKDALDSGDSEAVEASEVPGAEAEGIEQGGNTEVRDRDTFGSGESADVSDDGNLVQDDMAEGETALASEEGPTRSDASKMPVSFKVAGTIGGRNVTFSAETEDAVIYYSAKTSKLTNDDIYVRNGETVLFKNFYGTIYARAYKDGTWGNVSRLILKIPTVKTPRISARDGVVSIKTDTPDCTIYYTTDGTTPSPSNGQSLKKSAGTFTAASNCTVKAIAVRSCFANSEVAIAKVAAKKLGAPSFQVKGVIGGREVTFNSTEPNAEIYYSFKTSAITTNDSHVKAGEKVLFQNYYGTVYAKTYINGQWSNVSRLILKIPVVNKPSITVSGTDRVKISTTTPGCTIYYTTDGSTPSPKDGKSKKVGSSSTTINVENSKTVKAIAVRSCFTNSDVASWDRNLASLPGLNEQATVENVLAVLEEYDSDGYHIMKAVQAAGENVLWTYSPKENVLSGINTAVHENCHSYIHRNAGWNSEAIYVGGGKHILVDYTDVFYSTEMVSSIPADLRTFRFDTYVNTDDTLMASVQYGAYGLLNEFCAYCWGTNSAVKMFPYYKTFPAEPDTYFQYAQSAGGTMLAYAEFRYYILSYLLYAKEHYPQVYNGILQNENFRTAYLTIDSTYAKVIRDFKGNIDEIIRIMSQNGYSARVEGEYEYLWIGSGESTRGVSLIGKDYQKLMKEMEKNQYQQVMAELSKE